MGSSSKNKGGGFRQDPNAGRKPDAKMTKGAGSKDTNAYYSDKSMVPQTGGLVRPDSAPGLMQGIGLNNYVPPTPSPQRDQLASAMPRRQLTDWERGSPFFGTGVPGSYGDSRGYDFGGDIRRMGRG
jgi:hypothetical protein